MLTLWTVSTRLHYRREEYDLRRARARRPAAPACATTAAARSHISPTRATPRRCAADTCVQRLCEHFDCADPAGACTQQCVSPCWNKLGSAPYLHDCASCHSVDLAVAVAIPFVGRLGVDFLTLEGQGDGEARAVAGAAHRLLQAERRPRRRGTARRRLLGRRRGGRAAGALHGEDADGHSRPPLQLGRRGRTAWGSRPSAP